MNNIRSKWTASVVILSVLISASAFGQKSSKTWIAERNVRSAMTFLAGDAMQGRGSGTPFERVAAEYVGSQFMQFGLEPAGENDAAGKPTFVQTVNISRGAFADAPALNFGNVSLKHGESILVMRTTAGPASGSLQKLKPGDKVRSGSAVLIRSEGVEARKLTEDIQAMISAGASMVLVEETQQWRTNWKNMASRRVSFTTLSTSVKPLAVVILSKEIAEAVADLAEGTQFELAGDLAPVQKQQTWNAIGKIPGTDTKLASQVILLSSHLDHVGVRENAPGEDKIFNGADDDASGTVAVLELARVIAEGKRPKRTVYFVCFGSEEAGGHGANYFVNNLPFPQDKFVANLEFEMIGRPDAKVKPEELWLTGYERSNLGPELAKRGAKLVQDPHPQENFFQRSDNYTLARRGIIAHTVSSFGLHTDYHKASDQINTIDFGHMTRSINSMVEPIQWLVNSDFIPAWNEGKKP